MPRVLESPAKQGRARERFGFHRWLFYVLSNYLLGSDCVLGRREGTINKAEAAFLLTAAADLQGRENKCLLIIRAVAVQRGTSIGGQLSLLLNQEKQVFENSRIQKAKVTQGMCLGSIITPPAV